MLGLPYIREHADELRDILANKLFTDAPIDEILRLDDERRRLVSEADDLRARRNAAGKVIGRAKDPEERQRLIDAQRAESQRIDELEARLAELEPRLQQLLLEVPNIPDPDVPVGRDDSSNIVVAMEGALPEFPFEPLPHWELGERLGVIDFERGVKLSGSRFYVLRGAGARLQRALIDWMLDMHREEHGYTEVYPPFLVREETLVGTGNLPKFADNLYRDIEDDLWLVPTAEVPVTNLHRDEILPSEALPLRYVAYTPCFRREKMSAGRDVRGIKRGHQFDKVELVKLVHPEDSDDELRTLLADATHIVRGLGLAYRVVQLCTGDLGFKAAKAFDVELWAPGCGEWLEVSSCSNFRDFQARRANIRFRRSREDRPEFVHTLNGSALALPRLMIAILETYQREDGTVDVPPVLHPYMRGTTQLRPEPHV
ncbi:MAG TPA: serine--tRNA ligase [Dehalococcoidia bacterium]|nr:serine--tRNA ligase [Dehalococcoidia bacterium]